jgi:hypothetical protein
MDNPGQGGPLGFQALLSAYLDGRDRARGQRNKAVLATLTRRDDQRSANSEPGEGSEFAVPAHDLLKRLTPHAQNAARERADILFAFVHGLSHYPYEARADMLAHASRYLQRLGFTSEEIATFDPTDANLEGIAAAARHLLHGQPASAPG